MKKKKNPIYERYRKVLRKPKLSNEEIDKIRFNVRLLALTIIEHVLKSKLDQII
jgi:hypothetical protein